jgi:SWI/SNF related-matrix-associated actin-dependent regulator of chromatin subfamily C
MAEDEGEEAEGDTCRVLKTRGDKCLVHWWFYPDSYDEWISSGDVEGDVSALDGQQLESGGKDVSIREMR